MAVNYSRSEAEAEEVVRAVRALGRKALAVKADVSKDGEVRELAKKVLAEFGRVDVLVNNAGKDPIT